MAKNHAKNAGECYADTLIPNAGVRHMSFGTEVLRQRFGNPSPGTLTRSEVGDIIGKPNIGFTVTMTDERHTKKRSGKTC